MIKITFPDQSIIEFPKVINGFEIARSTSPSLAKSALVIEVNGKLQDLSSKIEQNSSIKIITDSLEIIRHDAAHIMAQAVRILYPEAKPVIGPATDEGFYYDFDYATAFTLEDLDRIEAKMYEISKQDYKFVREVWSKDKAIEFFQARGDKYKIEIIKAIPDGEDVSVYWQGDFVDLCRGPHSPSTGYIKHFKLLKLAGAYWRGNSKNQMLQRIYGTAFASKKELDDYLFILEEAKRKDHRKIGRDLDLFHIQEEAVGSVFWHHKGFVIYKIIENYIRNQLMKNDYTEVKTPQLIDKVLWEKSGHWEKFRENMFVVEADEGRSLAVKPMNCPGHVQIFNFKLKSYRELPYRISEFGTCHRNESSGSLFGLMRVRNFTQDDAHIFCTEDQITSETANFCRLLFKVYKDFGFEDIKVKFSDRPQNRAGSDEIWDKAEKALADATHEAGLEYSINKGEGAFYGPKLEFVLKDAIGRDWQCGTLQVDFVLPERLDASYIGADSKKYRPVMLHRAILGTLERFIGILIENYEGKFPLWLCPIQVAIATITNEVDDYAANLYEKLTEIGARCELDQSAEKISYKIRQYSNQKIPYILAIGKEEKLNDSVSIRVIGSNSSITLKVEDFINHLKKYINDPQKKDYSLS